MLKISYIALSYATIVVPEKNAKRNSISEPAKEKITK